MQEPSEVWPPLWMAHLERAHDSTARALPLLEEGEAVPADLEGLERALLRALERLYTAFFQQGDQALAANESVGAFDEAIAVLAPLASSYPHLGEVLGHLQAARTSLLAAGERLVLLVPRPPQPVPDLRASTRNVPELFVLDRPILLPMLRLPVPLPAVLVEATEAPPRPRSFEDMDKSFAALREKHDKRRDALRGEAAAARPVRAAAPAAETLPGFVAEPRPAISELAFVHDKTRECFEEVCMIGTQRAPLLGDPWRSSLALEQRMLAAIDSIAAMGPRAVARIEPLVRDSPITDASRLFGICMVLGCIDGRDALGAAERAVLPRLEDPACAAQVAAALQLAPHPLLPLLLRTWLAHPEPAHRAVAIEVLGYRGLTTPEELARAVRDEPPVFAAALPWFAQSADPGVRDAVEAALASEDPVLREAGARALLASGHPHAASTLARMLQAGDPMENVPWYLALVGAGDDAAVVLERAMATPTRALIQAVGWAGAGAAVPRLMSLLRHKKADIRLAAAYALDRITGAGLWEEAEVLAEEIEVPDVADPPLPEEGPGGARPPELEDRDPPAQPAPETIERPTTDTRRWSEFWKERGPAFAPDKRYRRGYPYSPLITLRELDGVWPATPVERSALQLELVVRTGSSAVRLQPHDFVVVQEEAIRAWEEPATRASGSAGGWLRPLRR